MSPVNVFISIKAESILKVFSNSPIKLIRLVSSFVSSNEIGLSVEYNKI